MRYFVFFIAFIAMVVLPSCGGNKSFVKSNSVTTEARLINDANRYNRLRIESCSSLRKLLNGGAAWDDAAPSSCRLYTEQQYIAAVAEVTKLKKLIKEKSTVVVRQPILWKYLEIHFKDGKISKKNISLKLVGLPGVTLEPKIIFKANSFEVTLVYDGVTVKKEFFIKAGKKTFYLFLGRLNK